jgi:hypothetical protein
MEASKPTTPKPAVPPQRRPGPPPQIQDPGAPNDGPGYGPPPAGAPPPLNVGSGDRPTTPKPGTGR